MKAAVRERYGSPDVVELRDIDRPVPTGDQLLVRVRAASVNRADLDLIYPKPGFVRLFMGLRAPRAHRLGCDVAGIVEAVGPDVTRFQPGDEVFGDMYGFGLGSFAEYLCAPERAFLPVPTGMTLEDAATLPHAAILAIQGLRLRNGRTIGPGDRLLVVGASGNVGPFAVQLAKDKGAEVTGTCRTEKMDFVRSLGADHVIDYTTTDPAATEASYDWIVDVDGNLPIVRARRALRPNGVYVALGGTSWRILQQVILGPLLSRTSGGKRLGLMLWWKPFAADDIATLAGLMAAGIVVPAVDRRFSLADVVEALRHVDEGRARGKVLVIP